MKWEWYDDPNTCRLFIHLLLTANHEPKSWRGLTIERGQKLTSRAKLARETKLSEQEIRTCLDRLKSTSELTIQSTNRQTVITLCNYDSYQSTADFINQLVNQPDVTIATSDQPSNEQEDNKAKTQEAVSETSVSSCQLPLEDRPQPHRINAAKKAKPVPYQRIFELYAEKCPSLKQMRQRSTKRDTGARRLWGRAGGHKDEDRAWQYLQLFFDAAQDSGFRRGEQSNGQHPNWKADFVYITQDETIAKIMEGD